MTHTSDSPTAAPASLPRWIVVALVAVTSVRLLCSGLFPLTDTTEARYGAIALQMAATGDWVVPHTSPDIPFLGKPPLSFWMSAIGIELFGINAFAARFGPLLAAAFTVVLTILLGTRLWGRGAGWLAGLMLSTSGLFLVCAGTVQTDAALAAALALAMVSIPMAATASTHAGERLWGHLFFAGLGLGLLAKGPVAVVIAGVSIALWTMWKRPWPTLRRLPWISGPLVMLVIAVPWHLLVEVRNPGFIDSYLVGEHIRRFLEPGWESPYGDAHEAARGIIWLFWLVAVLPWGPLALAVHWSRPREASPPQPWISYLLCWAVGAAVFFTISRNIMITYVLPCAAPVALLAAWAFGPPSERREWWHRPAVIRSVAAIGPVAYLIASLFIMPAVGRRKSHACVIETFRALSGGQAARLIYLREFPFSAAFYGHEAGVTFFEDETDPGLLAALADPRPLYIVVDESDEDEVEEDIAVPLREVARFPDVLLLERVSSAAAE